MFQVHIVSFCDVYCLLFQRSGGSTPTKSPTSDSEQKPDFSQFSKSGDRAQVSDRFAKTRSVMIENLHFNAPPVNTGPPPPKSATLPPNFTTSSISEDLVSFFKMYPSTPVEQNVCSGLFILVI